MANTYTSNTIRVNNGDSTTFDTSDAADGIRILNAECRWRGVQTSSTSNNTSYKTNTNYDSATATTSTQYNNNSTSTGYATATPKQYYNNQWSDTEFGDGSGDGPSMYVTFPSINDTSRFEHHEIIAEIEPDPDNYDDSREYTLDFNLSVSVSNATINMTAGGYKKITRTVNSYNTGELGYVKLHKPWSDGNDVVLTITVKTVYSSPSSSDTVYRSYPSVPSGYNFHKHEMVVDGNTTTYYSNKVGDSVSVTSYDSNNTKSLLLRTYGKKTVTNSRTASTSFPSVPNGYNFYRHREEKSNGTNDYHYSNKVGYGRSITSNSTNNQVWVRLKTRGKKTTSSTSYYDTRDPSVSGNASASYNGTISDGNWTSWTSVSGFSPGSNTLNHSISESNKADFQIRYEWEYDVPTAVQTANISINGTTYSVALADMADPALVYDFYRTFTPTNGTLAFDVVDPNDPDSIPYYIYHPTHGKVSLRQLN